MQKGKQAGQPYCLSVSDIFWAIRAVVLFFTSHCSCLASQHHPFSSLILSFVIPSKTFQGFVVGSGEGREWKGQKRKRKRDVYLRAGSEGWGDGESPPRTNGKGNDLRGEARRCPANASRGILSSSVEAALLILCSALCVCCVEIRRLPSQPSEKPLCIILPYKETKAPRDAHSFEARCSWHPTLF